MCSGEAVQFWLWLAWSRSVGDFEALMTHGVVADVRAGLGLEPGGPSFRCYSRLRRVAGYGLD